MQSHDQNRKTQLIARAVDLALLTLTVVAITTAVWYVPQGDIVSVIIFALGVTVGLAIAWRKD